ncbi:MAG: endolytic transglycosylase MltG, partial [Melioribacteraceae bacterium]|nr:endolytic transglycosylase MltG [Melioribacteraceae bacterium]
INNPGKDAILAALYPEKHELFYFVYDGNGGHEFSKYYSEHIKNVEKYRRWLRSQK